MKKVAVKRATPKKAPAKVYGPRSDFGAAAGEYFTRQEADKRLLLEKLHALVVKAVPDATVAIKWGVPVFERNGKAICALAAFKEHVGLNFFAPPAALEDPDGRLEGGGKTSRMLKVRSAADIDSARIQRWLKAAVAARGQ